MIEGDRARLVGAVGEPDALLSADEATWGRIAADVRGGHGRLPARRLRVRQNLHLGVGFLAATSGIREPGAAALRRRQHAHGELSYVEAGAGEPVLCLHGLGGTKASFLPTVAALADSHRVIAARPARLRRLRQADRRRLRRAPTSRVRSGALLDALEIDRAHLVGNSMGGRVAIEVGLSEPERAEQIVLLSPALAWLRDSRGTSCCSSLRPELGLIQPTPRAVVEPHRAPHGPRRRRRLGRRRRRRVPARLPDPARPRRLLRRRPQHPTSTRRTATTASGPAFRRSSPNRCSSGAATTASSRSVHEATSRRAARRAPRRARLRPRAAVERPHETHARSGTSWRDDRAATGSG